MQNIPTKLHFNHACCSWFFDFRQSEIIIRLAVMLNSELNENPKYCKNQWSNISKIKKWFHRNRLKY